MEGINIDEIEKSAKPDKNCRVPWQVSDQSFCSNSVHFTLIVISLRGLNKMFSIFTDICILDYKYARCWL